MSVPRLGRTSLLPGRSSVPQCRVHHFTVITVLLVTTVVASSQPKDQCQQDSANFASQIHTIGSIDDALWAITKPDWNVYKLTPCGPGSDSLVHCMKVDSPIAVDTKWPKLAESVMSAANKKDFSFPIDNSVVMECSLFSHKAVLAMHSKSFNTTYFGFTFGTRESVLAYEPGGANMSAGLWISSDEEDKAFRLLDLGIKVEKLKFGQDNDGALIIQPNFTRKNICSTGSKDDLQVRFQGGDCSPPTDWSVSKGVFYHKQFYLFGSTKVYIFSEQAESDYTKLQTVSSTDFFQCHGQTTMAPPLTSSNVTFPQISTNSTNMSTTAKGSSTTIIIIVVVVIGLVVIVALVFAYFCWCRTKASKDGKSGGNIKLASSSSPNDSKVSAKARNVSKGSIKASQTKVRPVPPKAPLCKQAV